MLSVAVRGFHPKGLIPVVPSEAKNAHRAKCCTKPVAQHQQAAGELFDLPVCGQYRYVSCKIPHARRLHCLLEPGPMARPERIGHDEVQALAERGHRAMPDQRLGTGTPPGIGLRPGCGPLGGEPLIPRRTPFPS